MSEKIKNLQIMHRQLIDSSWSACCLPHSWFILSCIVVGTRPWLDRPSIGYISSRRLAKQGFLFFPSLLDILALSYKRPLRRRSPSRKATENRPKKSRFSSEHDLVWLVSCHARTAWLCCKIKLAKRSCVFQKFIHVIRTLWSPEGHGSSLQVRGGW